MAQEEEIKSFAEFWPHYVADHSQPATRALHLAGTTAALACAAALAARRKWKYIPLALIPGYGAAWVGHFFVERNKPASFKYPLWSFIADYKMIALMLAGKMEAEVERATNQGKDLPSAAGDHPSLIS